MMTRAIKPPSLTLFFQKRIAVEDLSKEQNYWESQHGQDEDKRCVFYRTALNNYFGTACTTHPITSVLQDVDVVQCN